jgi:hypothetical protein
MAADMGTLSPEQMLQQQQILRQQKMAEMLVQQGTQQPQGQMIGNRYVAPSFTQNLAGLANIYLGQKGIEKANQAQIDLAKQLRADENSAMADFLQQKQGRPAEMYPAQAGPMPTGGNIPLQESAPAVSPNPQAAYANLYANPKSSAVQRQFAFTKMNEGPIKLGAEETLLDPNTFKPVATGPDKVSNDFRDYQQAVKDPISPFKGSFVDYQTLNNRSKASVTNVSVNAANKFAGGFADKASGGVYDLYTAAQNAPQQIENSKRTIELVNSGALTGPTADVALQAAKIFNVAGADNADTIKQTELLAANRGKALLASVKQSGLAGSQGLTEGERRFLTDAEGGRITLSGPTLKAMAGLEIKLAVQNQKRWNQQASKMDKDILNVTGAGPVEVYTGIGTVDENNPLLTPKR